MRDSNFNFPAHNRACVCISSSLYDRRALDAPAASLPLVNSLTHLSYLTATSARIRESLSSDGGLERLVRILENCANPTALTTRLADVKGKGRAVPKQRKARTSPFKAFAEYDLLPTLEDLQDLAAVSGRQGGALSSILPALPQGSTLPAGLLLPPSLKSRHLLYTYTLAFQCIVNIGVRGSEAIRTRVVEAGALQVVVHVLERYLDEIERKRVKNEVAWHKAEQSRLAQAQLLEVQAMMEGRMQEERDEEDDRTVIVVDTSSPTLVTPAPTPTRLRLTRINIVAASSSAGAEALAPPSRVQTPDTVLSNDDASLTGDDNGSSSGQETEEITMSTMTSEEQVEAARLAAKAGAQGGPSQGNDEGSSDALGPLPLSVTDDNGDVAMSGPSSPVEERSEAEVEPSTTREVDAQRTRDPTPRGSMQSEPLPAPTPIHRTPRTATGESRGHARRTHHPHPATVESPSSPSTSSATASEQAEGQLYFRDEDVLLALQLLAYLSKYPHVRDVFHSPSAPSHSCCPSSCSSGDSDCDDDHSHTVVGDPRSTNIFSLVELFTHRPPSDDPFTPRLSNEVQYWACTIMRNACRKDEQRGGIRQCANMNCGRWEQYAREFAKCRRCRRAKYCSKACQSASWGNGHKFWCQKQNPDEQRERSTRRRTAGESGAADSLTPGGGGAGGHGAESNGVPTPTNASPLPGGPASAHHARRRHRRATAGGAEDEDDDDLPPPVAAASILAAQQAGGVPIITRNRSGTIISPNDHHAHPLVQPTPPPGMEGQGGGEGGMPVTVDEDQIARDMMSMGDQEGVRIQDA
ncbi:hypothetical protein JCM11491_003130 [Sporobolomyces phaffii]